MLLVRVQTYRPLIIDFEWRPRAASTRRRLQAHLNLGRGLSSGEASLQLASFIQKQTDGLPYLTKDS